MTQSNYNTLNIILFVILAFAFFLGSLQYGRLTLDFDHIEKALKTERIAREKLMERVLAAEKRPDINIKYGTVITDKDAIIVVEEEK